MYLIDLSEGDAVKTLKTLWNEIKLYSEETYAKPAFIVGNKIDIVPEDAEKELREFAEIRNIKYMSISAKERINTDELVQMMGDKIKETPAPKTQVSNQIRLIVPKRKIDITIVDGEFVVEYEPLERIIHATDINSIDGRAFVHRQMERVGIEKKLRSMGADDGDTIVIGTERFVLE
ncbi:MAG: Obg family GTPase CgtA [Caldisericia bacterium]